MNMNKVKKLLILVVILVVVYIIYLYIKRLSKKAYVLVTEDKLFYNQPNNAMLMKEIDDMLNQWIHNSIVRKRLRNLIVKAINKNNQK